MRNTTKMDMVRQFHVAMGQPVDVPLHLDIFFGQMAEKQTALLDLRDRLIQEEANEVYAASTEEELLKELCDLLYVTYGYAVTFGLDVDTAFNRVHQSNMSKLVDGKPLVREDGKILKGPNYKPPYLRDLV